jgi:GntR family transcriptional regulator
VPLEPQRPQYRQIADLIRAAVDAGEYEPGQALPSEPVLADRYGVSRPTVNRAISILRNEGVIRVIRGKGSIVREIPAIQRQATSRYQQTNRGQSGGRGAFDGEIRGLGLTPRSDVEVSRVIPPAAVAQTLDIPEGEPNVVMRKRHMYANDVPVQLAPSYIPLDIAAGTALEQQDSGPGGIVSRFADLGYAQVRITERVKVRRATEEEQTFLRLEDDEPVIEIFHAGWTSEGRAVEVCVHSVPAYLWTLNYDWSIE